MGPILGTNRVVMSHTGSHHSSFFMGGSASRINLPANNLFGNGLDDLAQVYHQVRESNLESRQYNHRCLNVRVNVQTSLQMSDTVTVIVDELIDKFISVWDSEYEVIRVRGTTHWLRHQQTGTERKLHRERS